MRSALVHEEAHERMRVVFVSFDFGEYCVRLASALSRKAQVLLVMPTDTIHGQEWLLDPEVDVFTFKKPRLRHGLRQIQTITKIHRIIKAFKPDVIHAQGTHPWFLISLPFLKQYPLVITSHDPRHHIGDRASYKNPQMLLDFGYRHADHVIIHCRALIQSVKEDLGFPLDHIHVVPHIAIGCRPTEPDVTENSNEILFFGRLFAYKGLEYLIQAESLITQAIPDVTIVIAGTGDAIAPYQNMMVHPERFRVEYRWIPEEERVLFFKRTSLVVLPYIEATQSGVIPNAYTFSKPVVATRTGGLPEMVDHGITGLLVPPRDVPALADAIISLLNDPEKRMKMGRAGYKKLQRECSPGVVADQTIAVYKHALVHHKQSKRSSSTSSSPLANPLDIQYK